MRAPLFNFGSRNVGMANCNVNAASTQETNRGLGCETQQPTSLGTRWQKMECLRCIEKTCLCNKSEKPEDMRYREDSYTTACPANLFIGENRIFLVFKKRQSQKRH